MYVVSSVFIWRRTCRRMRSGAAAGEAGAR